MLLRVSSFDDPDNCNKFPAVSVSLYDKYPPSPITVNLPYGVVVLMPTLPLVVICILVVEFVSNCSALLSFVPNIAVVPNEFPSCLKNVLVSNGGLSEFDDV